MPVTIARISIAPVKSLGLVAVDKVELGPDGVADNRRFWLTDEQGRLFNNKRAGPLALIRPAWSKETQRLELRFPDGAVVGAEVELGPPVDATLYGAPHPSRRVVGPWEEALSAYAGERLRLLWSESGATDRGPEGGTVSLVSSASLEALGDAAGGGALDGRRFRMLFEVDGATAYEEDGWIAHDVRLGEAGVRFEGDIGRCVVTSHNPDTGVTDIDTLRVLARIRPDGVTEDLPFGIYGRVLRPGLVRVGDPVEP